MYYVCTSFEFKVICQIIFFPAPNRKLNLFLLFKKKFPQILAEQKPIEGYRNCEGCSSEQKFSKANSLDKARHSRIIPDIHILTLSSLPHFHDFVNSEKQSLTFNISVFNIVKMNFLLCMCSFPYSVCCP